MNLVDTFVSYGFKPETCSQRTHFPFVVVEVVDANVVDVSVVVEVEVVEEVDSVVLGSRVVAVCHDLCQLIFLEYPHSPSIVEPTWGHVDGPPDATRYVLVTTTG